jgi:hypothetical protein
MRIRSTPGGSFPVGNSIRSVRTDRASKRPQIQNEAERAHRKK